MALKTVIPFPIFAPIPTTTSAPTTTEVRFSRWNNANAENSFRNRRTQQQIEDELRRVRRFESALKIADVYDSATTPTTTPNFRSTGTPSAPSHPSIPGKKSKYSKKPPSSHPAFRNIPKRSKLPTVNETQREVNEAEVKVGENGLSYMVPGAPFEFMYSYTEAPKKVKPLGLREPPIAPFEPTTMARPWTGRKPLPPSKKKVPEFDSFKPPPANKKGVKPVQKPGPFLAGSGPKYAMSREEVLGEPLTEEEVNELVEACRKSKRQLNMGRDGLTHNMLDNIHAHWKRRRVCKVKCKGVCTVDMDNVCEQLEEKTGGKIIYRKGGVLYLFRGRNYNYKTRPRFPLMLWKPVTPVYPRLVQQVPEGLTLEEASDMRKRGRESVPICKLGKNGVYANLVKNVREAFEECELVRVNCQGLNPSDYRRIGAKLKDLVPCVLISFENEHILMWRGREWKSSLLPPKDGRGENGHITDGATYASSFTTHSSTLEDEGESSSCSSNILIEGASSEMPNLTLVSIDDSDVASAQGSETMSNIDGSSDDDNKSTVYTFEKETRINEDLFDEDAHDIGDSEFPLGNSTADSVTDGQMLATTEASQDRSASPLASQCTEGVLFLLKQAVESGSAIILDNISLDADVVYQRSVAFAQVAPPGPVFRHRPRKVAIPKCEEREIGDLQVEEAVQAPVLEKKSNEKKSRQRRSSRTQKAEDFKEDHLDVVPQGILKIDDLARLLA